MMIARPRYDVVVIGGGPAGLSAALYLGRSRRRTLVLDGGRPRNAPAAHAHGVFTRDGTPPGELLAEARRQIRHYPDVELRACMVESAAGSRGEFTIRLADGGILHARRLLIACGVRDEFPAIEGLAAHWGTLVHGCAYCHGYEVRDRPLAALTDAGTARATAASLMALSRDVLLCSNGDAVPLNDRRLIEQRAVRIIESRLTRVERTGDAAALHFADGSVIERSALFVKSRLRITGGIVSELGCRLEGPGRVVVNSLWETSVAGVYAAGDIATAKKFVTVAAASGVEAATAIDGALAQEDFGGEWSGPLCGASPDIAMAPATQ